MNKKRGISKRLVFLIKFIITIALCVFILQRVNWHSILEALQNSNLTLIFIVLSFMGLNVLLSALKWKILLSVHNIFFSFSTLSKYYFTAFFFNNFLPSNIGGDGYRIYKTYKNPRSKAGAVIAIFVERITGIFALLILGFIGGLVSYFQNGDKISKIAIIIGLIGFSTTIFLSIALVLKKNINWLLNRNFFSAKIKKVVELIGNHRRHPIKLLQIALISLLFHVIFISFRFILIQAVGENISIFNLALAVLISTLVALIPITLNGIGLMDGSFIYLLVNYGINYDQAVIVMVLIRALQIILSLVGGILYFADRRSIKVKEIHAENVSLR